MHLAAYIKSGLVSCYKYPHIVTKNGGVEKYIQKSNICFIRSSTYDKVSTHYVRLHL